MVGFLSKYSFETGRNHEVTLAINRNERFRGNQILVFFLVMLLNISVLRMYTDNQVCNRCRTKNELPMICLFFKASYRMLVKKIEMREEIDRILCSIKI